MGNKRMKVSLHSSSGSEVRRSKRLKSDPSNPSSLNSSNNDPVPEVDHFKKKLLIKLSRFDAATVESHEMSNQIQKLLEDRESLLAKQREMNEQTIKQLRNELEISMKRIHEARAAKAAAESEISQMKKQNIKLLMENTELKNSVIVSHSRTTSSLNLQINTITDQAKLRALEAKASRVDELEEELQTARDTISSLGEALKGKRRLEKRISDLQNKMDKAESQRQQMEKLERECEKLSSRVQKYLDSGRQTLRPVEGEDVLMNQNDSLSQSNELEDPPPQAIEEIPRQDCESDGKELGQREEVRPEIYRGPMDNFAGRSGQYSFSRPSNRRFSDLDWDEEYSHEMPGQWACKSCNFVVGRCSSIEDHVWTVHYEGHFECRNCILGSTSFQSRNSLRAHARAKHPKLIPLIGSLAVRMP